MGWKEDLRRNLGTGGTATTSAQPLPEWKRKLKENLRPIIESKKAEIASQPQPVKPIDAVTNAQNLYSGKGFVAYDKTIGRPNPATLPKSQYNPFGSLESRININPTVANSTKAIPGAMETKLDVVSPIASKVKPVVRDVIKLSYDTHPFMPSRSNPLQSNFEVALAPAEKKIFEKTLNTDLGKKVITSISESTEDIPLKLLSRLEAAGTSKTYGEVYSGWKKAKENPDNPLWKKFVYNFQSSAPQSLLGVAMSFIPYAGKPLSYAYWSALSAGEQIKDKGEVTSAQNIAIDTIGDSLLGGSLEGLFKKPTKTLISTLKKSFLTEGGTESAQTLLKYANDYRTAKNETDRNQAISNAKQYITSGDILMEFAIGGLSGASIGGLSFAANKTIGQQPGLSMPDKPTDPTGLQFSGQELLQPNQGVAAPTGPVLDFGSPSAVSQPVEPQVAAGETIDMPGSSRPTINQPTTQLDKPSNEVYNSKTSLIEESKKYKSSDEFIRSQDVDNNLINIYNKLYGKEENSNQFVIPEGLYRGQGLSRNERTGAIGSLPKDVEGSLSGLSDFINKNPDGFTVNLTGKPVSSGFAVSPYKGREVILDQVDKTSLRSFLLDNIDLLKEEGNNFGGWLNNEDGKFYLDISKVVDNIDDAIGYAAYNDQIAIFDLGNQSEITTKDFLKSRLEDVWNETNKSQSVKTTAKQKATQSTQEETQSKKKSTSSAQADKGVYAEDVVGKGKTEFKTIETPEQYRLAKSLGKDMKFIMKSSSRFNGFFRPEPGGDSVVIGMNRNLYKKGKEETSQQYQTRIGKTMAHEIGHFIDFLPEGNMKRGNLIGRLQSLSEFKKNFMTEPEVLDERKKLMKQINKINKDENLTEETKMKMVEPLMKELAKINESIEFNNPIYKEELVNLSKTWKPWTEGVDERYDSYRKSSAELYADFVSVLFNDPALAQEKAPRFYNGFFSALNNKPEVEQSLLGIQGELMGDRTSLMTKRYNMLKDSGKNAQGRFAATVAERQALNKKPWLQALMRDNWYQHYWVKKYGKKVENLMEVLDRGFNNELYTWTEKNVKPIMDKLTAAGLDANDMDAVLSLERIAKDASRANVANVKGLDVKTAEDVLVELENIVGSDKAKVLLDTASDLRSALKEIQKGFPDLFTQEQMDLIDSNDFYVPFNVLFNESNNIGYYIRESKGNIDKDFSPFVNTLLRTKSVIHFGEKNLIKKGVIDSIIDENAGDIKKAIVTHNKMADGQIVRNVKDAPAGWGIVEIKREGKLESYYLPEDIAHSLNQDDLGKLSAIIKPLNIIQKPFKELYTGIINPGFQITNFVFRDWGQTSMFFSPEWSRAQQGKSNAGLNIIANNTYRQLFSTINQARFYWKSFKNIKEKNLFRKYSPIVEEGLKSHIIEVDINGMYKIDTKNLTEQEQAGIKYILQTMGLIEKGSFFNRASNNIKGFTQSLEETPKLAAYMYMQELGVVNEDNLSAIRNYVGSPNFWKQGRDNKNISSVFMFYNPIIRGLENLGKKAFIKDAAGKGSRTAFWFRVMRAAVIPALLQVAAEEGLFGDDLKKKYEMLPEYLKGNYLNIPLEIASNGKLRSISIPMDEDARLVHAFTRNIARAALNSKDRKIRNSALADILAYTGGQVPGTAPAITITSQWSIMLAGGNPYDTFRRQNIFLQNEEELPLSEKSKIMAKWTLNQSGILKLDLHDNVSNQTTFEQVLTFAPAIGRFVRSTNRGEYEADQMVVEEERKNAALKLMQKKKVVNDIVEKLHKNPDYNAARDILDMAKERLGPEASDSAKLVKEFKLLNSAAQEEYVTNFGNVHYRSIINQSNDVKEKVMVDIWNRKAMNKKEFLDFVLTASNLSIISKEVRNNVLLSTGVLNK